MSEGSAFLLAGFCVYCGQRTEADTPEALVEVIEAHTLTCDQRPEARLTARIEELERALAARDAEVRALREEVERKRAMLERVARSPQLNCDLNHARPCDCVGDEIRAALAPDRAGRD